MNIIRAVAKRLMKFYYSGADTPVLMKTAKKNIATIRGSAALSVLRGRGWELDIPSGMWKRIDYGKAKKKEGESYFD